MDDRPEDLTPLLENSRHVSSLPVGDEAVTMSSSTSKHLALPIKPPIRNKYTSVAKRAVLTGVGLCIIIFAFSVWYAHDPERSQATMYLKNSANAPLHKPHIAPSQTVYISKKAQISRNFIPHFESQDLLNSLLEKMTKTESELWQQVKLLHSSYFRAEPVGTRHPRAIFKSDSRAPSVRPMPELKQLRDPGELPYREGNKEKHYLLIGLLQSARDGEYTGGGYCPTSLMWMARHAALQKDMLSGKEPLKITAFICGVSCGGFADRMLGMISSLAYSIVHNRAWVTDWKDQQLPETSYDSPWIDWTHPTSAEEEKNNPIFSNLAARERTVLHNSLMFRGPDLDGAWGEYDWETSLNLTDQSVHPLTAAAKSDWLMFSSNRGAARRFFKNPSARKKFNKIGLYQDSIYTCLTDYLVRPRIEILNFVAPISAYLSLPTVFSVGIQIRTGDSEMFHRVDEATAHEAFKRHSHFFECAEQVATRFAQKDQRIVYFVMSDSQMLKDEAKKAFPEKVLTNKQPPGHVFYNADPQATSNVIAELEIMHATDLKIVSFCSGLGTLAALRSKNHGRTIALPASNENTDNPACPLKPHRLQKSSCMLDQAFVQTDELTELWSLG